jgi:PhnB protein
MAVAPIPAGYHSVTPYLIVKDAVKALDFYKRAFGATELLRLDNPDGTIAHGEFRIGDSPVMFAEAMDTYRDPKAIGGSPVSFMIYVPDVDRVFAQALAAGATEQRPVADQFYGDRTGTLVDPFGHVWSIATHKEDLSQAEIDERFRKLVGGGG